MNLAFKNRLSFLRALLSATTLLAGCDVPFGDFDCQYLFYPESGGYIDSDDGRYQTGATCGETMCGKRAVVRGASLLLEMELSASEMAGPDVPDDSRFFSGTPETLDLTKVEDWEECGRPILEAEGVFREPGDAVVLLLNNGDEVARFTFQIHEAASIELGTRPDDDARDITSATSLKVERVTSLRLQPIVKSAGGERLATGGQVHFSIEDSDIAEMTKSYTYTEDAAEYGDEQFLAFKRIGKMRVHARIGDLTATLDIEVISNPEYDDAGIVEGVDGGPGDMCITDAMTASHDKIDRACAECLCANAEAAVNECTRTWDCWTTHVCVLEECGSPQDYACINLVCTPPWTDENNDAVLGIEDATIACQQRGLCEPST